MKDKTIEAYDKIAEHFHKTHALTIYQKEFEEFVKLLNGKKIIEIGCGTGRDAEALIKLGVEYTGIDASEGMLKKANERIKADFRLMSFYDLNFEEKTFDGFVAIASLLHIPKNKIKEVLISIKKIVKTNGIGLIAVKEKRQLDEGFIHQEDLGIDRFFAFYTEKEFAKLLEESGFEIIKSKPVGGLLHKREDDGTDWLIFFVKNS